MKVTVTANVPGIEIIGLDSLDSIPGLIKTATATAVTYTGFATQLDALHAAIGVLALHPNVTIQLTNTTLTITQHQRS